MFTDETGTIIEWVVAAIAILLFTPIEGAVMQVAVSSVSYLGMAVASIWDNDIRADMNAIGWNPFNSNESIAVNSNKVSFYKGAPVFLKNSGRCGSFYFISFNTQYGTDDLRHEWGHNIQAMIMGPANFGISVGIMSWKELGASKWRGYYYSPWETMADIFGGARSRTHTAAEITRARWYTAIGAVFSPATYFYLI